jgi:hypothetical protein
VDGLLSPQARRMACLAGVTVSFARAQRLLDQLCGWSVSDETLRHVCYRAARQVAAWRGRPAASREAFQKAKGDVELQIDAAKVNTDTGWRDVKIGIFAKRPAGAPSTPDDYQRRTLPPPSVRVAFCAIEPCEELGERTRRWAATLALVVPALLSVLGDGAEWIWEIAKGNFPGARQLLDLWHALDHVSQASAVLFGPGSAAGKAWQKEMALALLRDGWAGLCAEVGRAVASHPDGPARQALDGLVVYFAKHLPRLNYCVRLYKGQSIGSGMVEGAAKTVIGKRLKANAARWQVANVQLMGELCCLAYSDTWDAYWLAV